VPGQDGIEPDALLAVSMGEGPGVWRRGGRGRDANRRQPSLPPGVALRPNRRVGSSERSPQEHCRSWRATVSEVPSLTCPDDQQVLRRTRRFRIAAGAGARSVLAPRVAHRTTSRRRLGGRSDCRIPEKRKAAPAWPECGLIEEQSPTIESAAFCKPLDGEAGLGHWARRSYSPFRHAARHATGCFVIRKPQLRGRAACAAKARTASLIWRVDALDGQASCGGGQPDDLGTCPAAITPR
jgi:hypothetical protein